MPALAQWTEPVSPPPPHVMGMDSYIRLMIQLGTGPWTLIGDQRYLKLSRIPLV